jgi:YHS domain-containing protein
MENTGATGRFRELSSDPEAGRRSAHRTDPPPQQEVANMADTVKDPVCGMEIRSEAAAATEVHEGRTFYFCSKACHEKFVNDPHRYGHPKDEHGEHAGH